MIETSHGNVLTRLSVTSIMVIGLTLILIFSVMVSVINTGIRRGADMSKGVESQPPPCPDCGETPSWDEFDWYLHDYGPMHPPPCGHYNDDDDDACYGGWEQVMENEEYYDMLGDAFWAGRASVNEPD